MDGTSCDRHTGSLDEPRKPLAFGPSADSGPSKKLWTWHRKMRSFRYVVPCCVYTWTVPWLKRLGNRYKWIEKNIVFLFNELENVWRCMNQWRCEQLTLEDLQGVDGWGAGELSHYFQYMSYVHFELTSIAEKTSFQQPWILSGFVLPSSNISIHGSQIQQKIGVPEAISIRKLGHFWRDLCLKLLWKVGNPGWCQNLGC